MGRTPLKASFRKRESDMFQVLANATAALAEAAGLTRPWHVVANVTAKRDAGDQSVTVEARAGSKKGTVELRVTDAAGTVTPGPQKPVVAGLVGLTMSDVGLIARKRGGLTIASVPASPARSRAVVLNLRSNALAGL